MEQGIFNPYLFAFAIAPSTSAAITRLNNIFASLSSGSVTSYTIYYSLVATDQYFAIDPNVLPEFVLFDA